jgi:hypothetical protein
MLAGAAAALDMHAPRRQHDGEEVAAEIVSLYMCMTSGTVFLKNCSRRVARLSLSDKQSPVLHAATHDICEEAWRIRGGCSASNITHL